MSNHVPFTPEWVRALRERFGRALHPIAVEDQVCIEVGHCVASPDGKFASFSIRILEQGPDGLPTITSIRAEAEARLR